MDSGEGNNRLTSLVTELIIYQTDNFTNYFKIVCFLSGPIDTILIGMPK